MILTVNAQAGGKKDWSLSAGLPGLFDTLFAAGTKPLSSFSQAEMGCLRLFVRQHDQNQRIREQLHRACAERGVAIEIPELAGKDVDYHFIEVSFDSLDDAAEREYLKSIPTSFHLPPKDVDRIRAAAAKMLDAHPGFQNLLAEIQSSPPASASP